MGPLRKGLGLGETGQRTIAFIYKKLLNYLHF